MRAYDADHIRNVALVGHQGSGKTTLAEAMLYVSGALQRAGTIEEGSTVSDYHPSEAERQMSIFASLLHAEWKGHKINIFDTPGYPDFVGEVIASLKVSDTAIYVMNAAEGVQVGTELAWTYGTMTEKPSMFVINHLDQGEADFRALVEQLQERFGRGATVVQLPGGAGTRSIIDVLLMKQLTFPEDKKGQPKIGEIDDAFRDEAKRLHDELVENIAENDESLMELYFEKGELSEDEMRQGLHVAMLRRQLFPIFLTSATENVGVARLMSFIDNVCPSPAEMPGAATTDGGRVEADPEADPVALVYRTMAEAHVGEYSFFRVEAGTLRSGLDLENAQTGSSERLGQIYAINGHERDGVDEMVAGDVGALVKLKNTHTNNTLRAKGLDVVVAPIEFPRAPLPERHPCGQAGRGRQAGAGPPPACRGRPVARPHPRCAPGPASSGRAGRVAPGDRQIPPQKPLRRRDCLRPTQNILPRDGPDVGPRAVPPQKADGRRGPVCRHLGDGRARQR